MNTFQQQLKSRFAVLGVIVLLVLGSLLVRLWSMQVLSGESYALQSKNNRIREISLEAPRGRILDRKGKPLVTNRATLAVSVDPANGQVRELIIWAQSEDKTDDPTRSQIEAVFGGLADQLGMTSQEVFAKVADSQVEALRPRIVAIDVPLETVSILSERQQEFPGVRIDEVAVREYPNGSLAAHVIGYTGEISENQFAASDEASRYELGDIVGKTGAEAQFENVLQGDKGSRLIEVNAQGKPQRVIDEQPAVAGRDIRLTIDIDVQKVAEAALAEALKEAHRQNFPNAKAGAAVVIDVKTGEVLAMASVPTYDPTVFLGGVSTDDMGGPQREDERVPAQQPGDHGRVSAGVDLQGRHRTRRPAVQGHLQRQDVHVQRQVDRHGLAVAEMVLGPQRARDDLVRRWYRGIVRHRLLQHRLRVLQAQGRGAPGLLADVRAWFRHRNRPAR